MEPEITIVFQTDEALTDEQLTARLPQFGLREAPRDEIGSQDFGLVTGIVVVGVLAGMAALAMDMYETALGGTIIDASRSPTQIRRTSDLPRGYLVVIAKDGQVDVQLKDLPPGVAERIVKQFLEMGKEVTVSAAKTALAAINTSPVEAKNGAPTDKQT